MRHYTLARPVPRRLSPLRAGVIAAVTLASLAGCSASATTQSHAKSTTLTIAMQQAPPSLDPAQANNTFWNYFDLAYDPLIVQAPDGTFQPGLATSWSYGPNNESFSLKLRSQVRFSDGTAFDAAAVKTWINYALKYPGGAAPGYLGALTSIDVTGPLSLTMNFKSPTPNLPLVFSQLLEVGEIGSPKGISGKTLSTGTDGAGEYELDKAQTVTNDHYTYVPNPYYWNKSAIHWKQVVIKVIANPNAALSALETGQVQVAENLPITDASAAKSARQQVVAPLALMMALDLFDANGHLVKALGDVRVRQALNYAVDRNAIANLLGKGYGAPLGQMAIKGDDAYDPAIENQYAYNPAKAKQLLAQAGYANGFSFTALSWNQVQQDTMTEALAGQLAKVGVTLRPDIKSNIADVTSAFSSTNYPAAAISWGRLPAVFQYQLLWGPEASQANPFRIKSPTLDAIYDRLVRAPNSQSSAIAQEMMRYLMQQAWFIPAAATPLAVFYSPTLTNVNATQTRIQDYAVEDRPVS